MTPLYTTYITRHPTALTHLNSLPQTPALQSYLTRARELASAHTHAWELTDVAIARVTFMRCQESDRHRKRVRARE